MHVDRNVRHEDWEIPQWCVSGIWVVGCCAGSAIGLKTLLVGLPSPEILAPRDVPYHPPCDIVEMFSNYFQIRLDLGFVLVLTLSAL